MPTSETHIAASSGTGIEVFFHQSTLPSPQVVEAYEAFHKGAAKIMLEMAMSEQRTENDMRDRESRLAFIVRILGLCCAFLLTIGLLAAGTFLIATGHDLSGCLSLFTGILSVIGTIIRSARK